MRIFVTGASGFVGSNLVHVFRDRHGADVVAPGHEHVDLTDAALVTRAVAASRPDAIVHAAIWNAPAALERDRARAWAGYVGATRNVTDAANAAGIPVVLVSTDWVFDGTQGPAAEGEPPNPVNAYGFLKAASELVVTERAGHGIVARIAAVQGVHRARAAAPRAQDAGFGYFVAALVDTLRAGERFTVWDGEGLNALATPTLATDAGELIWRALERGVDRDAALLRRRARRPARPRAPRRGRVRPRPGPARRRAAARGGAAAGPGPARHAPRRDGDGRPARGGAARPRHPARASARGARCVARGPDGDDHHMSLDLITMGRVGVDLYPEQIGVQLPDVRTFAKSLGGTATNVAVAASRLGARSAVITKVGDDPFGIYVRQALEGFGVDTRYVSTHPTLRTPVVFCEIFPPDDFPLLFYRAPKAPDMELDSGDLDLDAIRAARIFWVTVTGLSDEPSRSATLAALEARGRAGITVLDLDYRPMFWASREEARRWIARGAAPRDGRGRQPGRVRHRGRRPRAARRGRRAARARRRAGDRQAGAEGRARARRRRGRRGPAGAGRGRQRARRRRRVRRRAVPRAARRLGARAARCASATRRARSSRRGSRAPTRCPRSPRCSRCSRGP